MPYHHARVQTQESLALSSPLAVRPLSPSDVPALADLYDRSWNNRVGALVRDEALWRWKLSSERQGDVTVGADGRVRGYAIYGNEANRAIEAAASDANAVAALLRRLAQRAQQAGQDNIYVQRPADALFARLARAMCGLDTIQHTHPAAGWQARILNIKSLFAKLSPELSDRLARSTLAGWRGCLRLETEIGGVSLLIERNKVQVDERARANLICLMPQSRLTQLLFGYITVAEAAVAPGSNIPYTASPLMAALFPPTVASIAGLDWF
jgi:predicted acetyltransferase